MPIEVKKDVQLEIAQQSGRWWRWATIRFGPTPLLF
jgi:hypothetical protein